MNRLGRTAILASMAGLVATGAPAASRATRALAPPLPPAAAPAQPSAPAPSAPAPYEPELLRLAQIIGSLAFLRDLCGDQDGAAWRAKMTALLTSMGDSEDRREKLAGAFNKGFRDYELIYRSCTPNARIVVSRYLSEGEKLAHEIQSRYGAS
jgi:uncharacterized protein (TIGR02301 family)